MGACAKDSLKCKRVINLKNISELQDLSILVTFVIFFVIIIISKIFDIEF